MLIGRRTDVDHILAALKTLVVGRIPEQRVRTLEQRHDLFAARRGITTHDMGNLAVVQHLLRQLKIACHVPSRVRYRRLKGEIKFRISRNLFDREQSARQDCLSRWAVRARGRAKKTKRYLRVSDHRYWHSVSSRIQSKKPIAPLKGRMGFFAGVALFRGQQQGNWNFS